MPILPTRRELTNRDARSYRQMVFDFATELSDAAVFDSPDSNDDMKDKAARFIFAVVERSESTRQIDCDCDCCRKWREHWEMTAANFVRL